MTRSPRTRFAEDRVVRHHDLRPCTTAFIDARTPGSDRKENFTIIGPGVAENPDQHVHIDEPHGFNIGGARQPPGCLNSQHFHETAEVFFVHSGTWAFRTGEAADEGQVVIQPGDLISIPVRVFRGFENVGEDTGFLFAVLGGDDPGRVTWAPDVLERARGHGLVLLESGKLLDTRTGAAPPADDPPVTPTPRNVLESVVQHADSTALEQVVARRGATRARVQETPPGVTETALIGPANPMEGAPAGPISWSHGFVCRLLDLDPGAAIGTHSRAEPEVLFVHEGDLTAEYDGALIRLGAGDVASIPAGEARGYRSEGGASVFVTRGGDTPSPPSWAEAVSGGGMLSPGRVDPAVASPAERPIEDLLSVRPRRQALDGFEPVYSDLVDYIIRCTHRIWEEKNVGLCRTHYSEDCPIHTLAGDVNGVEAVVRNTLATLAAFPDRTLIGEDVVWSEDRPGLFHSSHRIVSLMTHLGDDGFGPATGRRAQVTTIADCLVRENRIVEEWLVRDNAHLVAQLGIDPWTLARSQAESDAGAPAGTHEWRTAELTRVRAGDALAAPPPSDHPAAGPAQALELAVNEAQLGQAAEVLSVAVEGVWPSGRRWFGRGGWIGAWNQLTGVLASPRLVVDHWAATPLPRDEMAVALRWSLAGAHVQPGVYGPPTGRDLLVLGVSHYRLRGGRVIEDVTVFDELAMLRQLAGGLGA